MDHISHFLDNLIRKSQKQLLNFARLLKNEGNCFILSSKNHEIFLRGSKLSFLYLENGRQILFEVFQMYPI